MQRISSNTNFTYTVHRSMKSNRLSLALALAGILACAMQARAQRGAEAPQDAPPGPSTLQFGVYGGGALAPNSAEFATLPGMVSCQGDSILYGGSTGGGFTAAAVVGIMPGSGKDFLSHIGATLKVGLSSTSSTFETDERIGQAISPSGEVADVISRYTVSGSLSTLIIEPTAFYRVSADAPLLIGIGPTLGLLMGATYDQKEEVAAPSGARYADGRTERNVREGDIEETSGLLMGGTLSLAYEIKASAQISIRPEISGTLGFNGPVDDWTQHTLRAGLSILFSPAAAQSTPLGD